MPPAGDGTRYPRGQEHPRARLTDEQVAEIRDLHEQGGLGYKRLAARFNTSPSTIRNICTYATRD